jgi:hypothetical protein
VTATALRTLPDGAGAEIDALALESGVHPELVRRLLRLGIFDPAVPFPRDAAPRIARVVRLRRDLGLNYAGALLACELLDRIELLERRLRAYNNSTGSGGGARWIRTS